MQYRQAKPGLLIKNRYNPMQMYKKLMRNNFRSPGLVVNKLKAFKSLTSQNNYELEILSGE
ncbi:hypothetical protein [Thiomicrospira sp.]|uniref:hypothetical protein n=1 Tax=Thiomicrospira sp. TaxID=935 RepID=UPI002F925A6D